MSSSDQLTIRIDRGTRPSIQFNSATSSVQINVPLDLSVNYQPIRQEIGNGYHIQLQRMQQQYKIFMQHSHEKKPEFVVFASNIAHEKEIKTTVREVNTKLPDLTIAGSNLEVSGILKGHNLTFESTVGTMHVYAKITCSGSLQVHSQNIVIATEALLMTDVFKAICRKLQNDGKIFPLGPGDSGDSGGVRRSSSFKTPESIEQPEKTMAVELSCNLVHIGVDGSIGVSAKKPIQMADNLLLSVYGDVANYGKIQAKNRIELKVIGNHISLSDGSLDSAGRGYNALKQLKKINGKSVYDPSSSSMHTAIQSQNAQVVTELIENGIDLNDKLKKGKKALTLRQSAIKEYREAREKSNLNSVRERITLINALFVAHDWRRGSITANFISAVITRNCEDMAQFNAKTLKLKVGGVSTVEKDSIFSSGWVELEAKQNVFFHGQAKIKTLILHSDANVFTTNEAILSVEQFGRISCVKFTCSGMWCAGESLSLDTQGSIQFKEGSYLESAKLEVDCKSSLEVDGTWQLTTGWAHITQNFTISSNSKIFIEQSASISAQSLHFGGLCHVTDKIDMILQDSAHFFGSSRLEAHVLRLTCKGYCTIGGSIAINDLLSIYVRNELITTSTGKIAVMGSADVITGCFQNDSLWQVEKNLKMTSGSLEQSEDGTIFVKYSMAITLHEDCSEFFGGRLIGSEIQLKSLKICNFDGLIRCNEMQISIPYVNQSVVSLKGQVDIVAGSLTVNGNLEITEANEREKPVEPGVIIDCNLTAAAIIAPFASVHVAGNAVVRLNGIESFKRDEFNILLNCGALHTEKESVIVSMASEKSPETRIKCEGIICATTFFHRGQIKFSGDEVNVLTPVMIHEGRFSNVEGKANHVKSLFIHIGDLLLNNGILACDHLEIVGDGILENTNRIYATESMDIKLRNFNNDDGLIESKNSMRLLACSKEWTKISGSIKSKKPIDLLANRLNVAIRNIQNLSIDKRLCFSAKTDLLISSDVIDESKELSVGCAAQQSVSIDCQMQVDRLEVLLGAENPTVPSTFVVHQNSGILANTILITSNSEHVQVLFDGNVQCNRMRFSGNVKTVTIIGSGGLEAVYMLLPTASVSFEMYSVVRIDELQCASFDVLNDNILRLEACDSEEITTIVTEDVNIEGTLFLEKKLFVKSKKDTVRITGNILGSSVKSEFACECQKLIVKGQLGNFKFIELYARESISMQSLTIRHVEKLSLDCTDLCIYSADIENCQHVLMASDSLTASGSIRDGGDVIIQSINVHFKMDVENMERMAVFGKRSATLKGKVENVKSVEVDSKWINASCDVTGSSKIKLTGWGIVNNCQLSADSIDITALSVFVNNSAILCHDCHVTATFILSLTALSVITGDQKINMCSLCLCTRNDILSLEGVNYLWLNFDPVLNTVKLSSCSQTTVNSLKTTANLLRDRWMTSSIDADEILIGLKYISDLQETKIPLNTDNKVYEGLTELCSRFDSTPISLFNFSELINLIQMTKGLLQIVPQEVSHNKKSKKRSSGSLYESLVQFKHGKYSKESNDLSDTDIGYVSRSSSEDLNTKASRPRSPLHCDTSTSFFEHSHLEEIDEKVSKVEEELENELKLDHIAYAIREEEELAEFEELEDELEMAEEGIIRTDFIVCREKNIYLAKLKEKMRPISAPRPAVNISIQRIPSSNDLIMKKLQVKHAISNFDLRSFGSQSSLNSLDFGIGTVPDFGSPLQFSTKSSPFQRSKIPLGSFRSPKKAMSRMGAPSMYSSTLSRFSDRSEKL